MNAQTFDFETHRERWRELPCEGDRDILTGEALLQKTDEEIRSITAASIANRYAPGAWRGGSRWPELLHANVDGLVVMDFGCGLGVESLGLARAGAKVVLADINDASIMAADHVLEVHGFDSYGIEHVTGEPPFFSYTSLLEQRLDVFYSNGVLHHTPLITEILKRASECADELRILVWSQIMGSGDGEAYNEAWPYKKAKEHWSDFLTFEHHEPLGGGYFAVYFMRRKQ